MRRYDVYGFQSSQLEDAATFVESVLGIHLRYRDSSYRGIYYCASVHTPPVPTSRETAPLSKSV